MQPSRTVLRHVLSVLTSSLILASAGCGIGTVATSGGPASEGALSMGGTVHGGQQPVYNSTVRLYMAGSTGYGQGSTVLATTTTDGGGNFGFTKLNTTGPSAGTTTTWQCPSSGNPQIYITATGGNTQGTGVTSTNNSAMGLLAALGPCSSISSSTRISVNEVTSVASIFALAQYINPGTTAGSMTMGTSGTAQSLQGINNAYSSIANLANTAVGSIITPPTYTASSAGSANGVTITATAESAKINLIANILAACINTTNSSSIQCADLFANALPPAASSYTSQPTATFSQAVDTIQAGYYLATNPAALGTFTSCQTSASATTTMGCLFGLASATSPFQPSLATTASTGSGIPNTPSDFTLGVTYTAAGTCNGGGAFFFGPTKTSIDANGNIWVINGGAATAGSTVATSANVNVVELSPNGTPINCLGVAPSLNASSVVVAGSSNGRGLTIDPTGNIWASFNTTNVAGLLELPASALASASDSSLINWPTAVGGTAYTPYTATSDGVGNIYYTAIGTGGQLLQFASPLTTTTPTTATLLTPGTTGFNSTTSTTTNYSATDPANRIWVATSTTTATYESVYTANSTTATITGFSIAYTSGPYATVTFQAANSFTAGQRIVISGLSSSAATTANLNSTLSVLPGVTASSFQALIPYTSTVASTTDTGLSTAQTWGFGKTAPPTTSYGLALDANNYAYTGTTCCGTGTTSYKELVKITPAANGVGTVSASPQYLGGINGVRSVALDGAANVWVGNEFSSTSASNAGTNYPIAEIATAGSGTTATFTALSPTGASLAAAACTTGATIGCPTGGGFIKSDFAEVRDLAIDPSGNVWVLNTGSEASNYTGTSISEIVGAAVPTVTPLSLAAGTGKLASKP